MNRLRLAFRLAWRDIRNHKARTAFAVLLFSLPIMFNVSMISSVVDFSPYPADDPPQTSAWITEQTCEDYIATSLPRVCVPEDKVEQLRRTPDVERIAAALDDSTLADSFLPEFHFTAPLKGPRDVSAFSNIDAVVPDVRQDPKTIPQPGEIKLRSTDSQVVGATVGDEVTLRLGGVDTPLRVTEITPWGTTINAADAQSAFPAREKIVEAELPAGTAINWVSAEPVARTANEQGITFDTTVRHASGETSVLGELFSTQASAEDILITGSVFTLLVMLIACVTAPVFAVSARRKMAWLGTLSTTGARPRDLFAIMIAEGIIVSGIGGLFGIVVPFAIGTLDGGVTRTVRLLVGQWDGIIATLIVSLVCGIAAAIVPAFHAATVNPVDALNEGASIRLRKLRKRHFIAPFIALVAATGMATDLWVPQPVWMVVGAAAAIVASTTIVLLAAQLGAYLPVSLRLATRDAARNYLRTVPAVAAVSGTILLVVIFGAPFAHYSDDHSEAQLHNRAVTVYAYTDSSTSAPYEEIIDRYKQNYNLSLRTDSYTAQLPDGLAQPQLYLALPADRAKVSATEFDYPKFRSIAQEISSPAVSSLFIVDANAPETLAAVYPHVFSQEQIKQATQALAEGKVVTNDAGALRDGKARIIAEFANYSEYEPRVVDGFEVFTPPSVHADSHDFEAVVLSAAGDAGVPDLPQAFITPKALQQLKISSAYSKTCIARDTDFTLLESLRLQTIDQRAELAQVLEVKTSNKLDRYVIFSVPFTLGLALTLSVVLLVVLLAGAEARRDTETMIAVGATPSMIRRYAGAQGLVVGLLGTFAGVGYGLYAVMVATLHYGAEQGITPVGFAFIACVTVLVPLLSWLTGLLFGAHVHGRRGPARRVT